MAMKYEKSCGAVVWKTENGRRLYLAEHMIQGHTSLPKGHVEANETEAETALREIREETGLAAALDTGFRHVISYSPAPGVMKDVVFFTAEVTGGEMKNQEEEVSALAWMTYEDALEAMTFDTDRETLEQAEAYLNAKAE